MRQYELILIVQPDLDEEATDAVITRVKKPDHRQQRRNPKNRPVGFKTISI